MRQLRQMLRLAGSGTSSREIAVMLGVAALIVVMSVMNGFRAELFDKIVGLNGHAVVQGYGGRLDNWQAIAAQARATPGCTRATPLMEQPLLATFNGRVEAALIRGMTEPDIRANPSLRSKLVAGSLDSIRTGSGKVAIGSRLAENLGVHVGQTISVINPAGRSTPFAGSTNPADVGSRSRVLRSHCPIRSAMRE